MIRGKILVVDDEKRIRDTFIDAFEEYKIIPAASGEEALNILKCPHDIDLVVLDVMMPGLTGIELLREIKKMNPNQKVIIFTGCDSKDIVIEALRGQADEYMDKPFDIKEAKKIFERLLSRKESFAEEETTDIKRKIKQAQRLIERNYNKSILLRDIAREIFLSPKYLSRIFKEKTGRSFNKYKIAFRIQAAKQLLKKTELTISQIAYKVGYQNPESFMKIFKKFTGVVPSQYRVGTKRQR